MAEGLPNYDARLRSRASPDRRTVLEVNRRYPESARYAPRAQRASFSGVLGRLRKLGAQDLKREGSVLKSLLRRHSVDEVMLALDGLETLFPGQPVSLRMIHGRAMIGNYRGFVSATNAAIKASEVRQ